jgi:AcrR family transcriptional regulator
MVISQARTATRRQREREAREGAILAAARDLFLRNGIAATTVDDVARACQLAKGTLYLYFSSKDEIAFAVLLEATEDLLAALRESLDPDASALEQLQRLAVAYHRHFLARPEAFRFMFALPHEAYAGRVGEDLLDRWAAAGNATLGLVAGLLRRADAAGDLDVDDPWSTAVALWSALTGVIVIPSEEVRRPFIGDVDVEALVLRTVQSLLDGLRPGERRNPWKRARHDERRTT